MALDVPGSDITRALRSPSAPVLGKRDLVQTYRDFVKWNPADELCEYCLLTVAPCLQPSFYGRVEVFDLSLDQTATR